MATFVEDSVKVTLTVQKDQTGALQLVVTSSAYAGQIQTRSDVSWVAPWANLSAARQQGITDLFADAETFARQKFQIP